MLEAAVAVARDGTRTLPLEPAPTALRPYLAFRRLTGPALDAARRALDEDEAFRRRVTERVIGPDGAEDPMPPDDPGAAAARLVLRRPEGWERDLAALVEVVAAEAEEHDARSRARRLDRELERLTAERDEARTEAVQARRQQAAAEGSTLEEVQRGDALAAEVDALRQQVEALTEERRRAVRDLKAVERRLADRQAEVRALRQQLDVMAAHVDQLQARADLPTPPAAASTASVPTADPSPARPVAAAPAEGDERPAVPTDGPPLPPPVDVAAVAEAVGQAADAAADLTAALGAVARLVAPGTAGPSAPSAPVPGGSPPPSSSPSVAEGGVAESAGAGLPGARPPRRDAPRLPVGLFDDDPAAVHHLLRLPGAVVLVDGYNVTLTGWPELVLPDQRRRLVGALGPLAARSGCQVVVVFDGAEGGDGRPGESQPRGVQVRFTAPGVEADDEILDLVERYPLDRPVIVVSSDQRVADGARARGAAVVAARTLLAAL